MKLRIKFRKIAERELNDAAVWYEKQQPGLGLRFLNQMDEVFEAISSLKDSKSSSRPFVELLL